MLALCARTLTIYEKKATYLLTFNVVHARLRVQMQSNSHVQLFFRNTVSSFGWMSSTLRLPMTDMSWKVSNPGPSVMVLLTVTKIDTDLQTNVCSESGSPKGGHRHIKNLKRKKLEIQTPIPTGNPPTLESMCQRNTARKEGTPLTLMAGGQVVRSAAQA